MVGRLHMSGLVGQEQVRLSRYEVASQELVISSKSLHESTEHGREKDGERYAFHSASERYMSSKPSEPACECLT